MTAHTTSSADRTSTSTRRAMLKSIAGGAAAILATGRLADASGARPNRETGSAPNLKGLSGINNGAGAKPTHKRYERRSPD